MATWRRRLATGGNNTAEAVAPAHLALQRVTAVWPGGGSGAVIVKVDGTAIYTGAGTSPYVAHFDRLEPVAQGATITVELPAAGSANLSAIVRPCHV